MSSDLIFSVVIPVYNNPVDLKACLESLQSLDYEKGRYEVIVVDNNSTDETPEVARSFGVNCLTESTLQSSYAARNTGIRAARGRLIAFTDSDCQVDRNWLSNIENAAQDESIGCLAGEILSAPPQTLIERFSDSIGLLRQRGPLSGWHFKPYAQTANAVYRREVFELVGMFNHSMQSGGDAEIAWRMLDNTEYRLELVQDAAVYHHHRTSLPDLWSQFRRYGGGKMSWALAQKDYAPPSLDELEREIVDLLDKALSGLEQSGADEEKLIFPFLKSVSQIAHLTGYQRDLLRLLGRGVESGDIYKMALEVAQRCSLCESMSFIAGEAIEKGENICHDCGSRAEDRILGRALRSMGEKRLATSSVVVIGDFPTETLPNICAATRIATLAELGQRAAADYVLVKSLDRLIHNGEAVALNKMVSPLKQNGALLLCANVETEDASLLDARISELLPNASVRSAWVRDPASDTVRLLIAAAADVGTAAKLTLGA